jgi:anthranilate synthase component 2
MSTDVIVIDNYDSFTYNLVQYLGELGASVQVYRNDALSLESLLALRPRRLLVSPGPCTPNEAGVSVAAIAALGPHIPVLGVCLGHQSLGAAYGARVVRAQTLMHGKVSVLEHQGASVFAGLPTRYKVNRYHSLALERASLPDCLEVTAWCDDGEIMGVRHRQFNVHGVQFHPESILTQHGHALLQNFLRA